jgi:hypothetical protein
VHKRTPRQKKPKALPAPAAAAPPAIEAPPPPDLPAWAKWKRERASGHNVTFFKANPIYAPQPQAAGPVAVAAPPRVGLFGRYSLFATHSLLIQFCHRIAIPSSKVECIMNFIKMLVYQYGRLSHSRLAFLLSMLCRLLSNLLAFSASSETISL